MIHSILACPMCVGGAEGKMAMAANSAIGLLFTVLCLVLMGFLSFIVYLAKRARRVALEDGIESDDR